MQSDNGREFTATLIKEIATAFPGLKLINGRPRFPQSQGSVERSNQDVELMLRSWCKDNSTNDWVVGLHFVQLMKNTSHHRIIGRSPFQALFGKAPKIGADALQLPPEILERVETEEDLDPYLASENSQSTDETSQSEIDPGMEISASDMGHSPSLELLPEENEVENLPSTSSTINQPDVTFATLQPSVEKKCISCSGSISGMHTCVTCNQVI